MRNGKTFLRFIAAFFLCFVAGSASAQFTKAQKAELNYPGLLKNGGFERGLYSWTASGLTAGLQTSSPIDGTAYAALSGTAGNTWSSEDASVPTGYAYNRCKAQWLMNGTAGTVTVSVIDGTPTTVASQIYNMNNLSNQRGILKFPCLAGNGTFKFRVTLGTATDIGLDSVYVGLDENDPTELRTENMIKGGDAESGGNGFALYDDGATATPVDGTGGTASAVGYPTITTTLGNIIAGSQTFELAKSAANGQGEGISYDFKLSNRSPLFSSLVRLSFDYYATSTNFATGDVLVYVYDVDNATLITPQFISCGGGSTPAIAFSGANKTCHAQLGFLTTTSDDYRLIFHVATTNATAWTLRLDNIFVGEASTAIGPASANCAPITFTGSLTTNVTYTAIECRNGDRATYSVYMPFTGTNTQGSASLTMPTGRTIDTTKIVGGTGGSAQILPQSFVVVNDASASNVTGFPGALSILSSTSLRMVVQQSSNTYGDGATLNTSTNVPITIANGDEIRIGFTVPIAEWAGGTAGFGENAIEYAYNTSTTDADDSTSFGYGPAGNVVPTVVSAAATNTRRKTVRFLTAIQPTDKIEMEIQSVGANAWVPFDAQADYQAFTIQNTVRYGIAFAASNSTDVQVDFYRGGRLTSGATYGATGASYPANGTDRWRLKKTSGGLAVGFGLADATVPGLVGSVGTTQSIGGVKSYPNQTYVRVYRNTSAQSVTTSTVTTVDWNAESVDRNSNFDTSTDTFTAPADGVYLFTSSIQFSGTGVSRAQVRLTHSSGVAYIGQDLQGVSTTNGNVNHSVAVEMTSGQTAKLEVFITGTSPLVQNGEGSTWMTISKIL